MIVPIDNIHINARHFGLMDKEEAIKRMIADGITKSEEWAEKAWEKCVEKVNGKKKVSK